MLWLSSFFSLNPLVGQVLNALIQKRGEKQTFPKEDMPFSSWLVMWLVSRSPHAAGRINLLTVLLSGPLLLPCVIILNGIKKKFMMFKLLELSEEDRS